MKREWSLTFVVMTGMGLLGWKALGVPEAAPESKPAAQASAEISIKLPVIPYDLPDGPGKSAVNAACVICHSTRYITMQPAFPRKTWEAEVDKMKKVFGAPVSDEQAGQIVTYLMSVRGKPTPATQP